MPSIFEKGGPVMWPLLVTSIVALTVVIERLIFIAREALRRDTAAVDQVLTQTEEGNIGGAIRTGQESKDFIARTLSEALAHRERSFSGALLRSANRELKRYSQGLSILDTIITLAPLLGLLGTVTGMIHAFGLLGTRELDAPTVITGGIAEALMATAFGLGIAIVSLIPFNYLNTRTEEARHAIEDASTHLELILNKPLKEKVYADSVAAR